METHLHTVGNVGALCQFSVTKVGQFSSKDTADELEQHGNNIRGFKYKLYIAGKLYTAETSFDYFFNYSTFACNFPSFHPDVLLFLRRVFCTVIRNTLAKPAGSGDVPK